MHRHPSQPPGHQAVAYVVRRTGGAGSVQCLRVADDGTTTPLAQRVHHSPTGMEYGYAGSGPADLAHTLLADVVGADVDPAIYQAFKHEVIARLDGDVDEHVLSADDIALWLAPDPDPAA